MFSVSIRSQLTLLICWLGLAELIQAASLSRQHIHIRHQHQPHPDPSNLGSSRSLASAKEGSAANTTSGQLRITACIHLKNEVPYLIEWLEFHRIQGFTHFVIYDDFSADNVSLLETLYREHGRHYITVYPPTGQGLTNNERRSHNAGHCSEHFSNDSDWMINIDVDEFVWSPAYHSVQEYLAAEVKEDMHMVYVGATRFGWGGQRHRFEYALQQVNGTGDHSVELSNPKGIQLLTSSHIHRAPDQRFGEPEQFLRDSNQRCREWQGEDSPCTNDYNGRYGKAFVRTQHAVSVWTHGGGVRGAFGEGSMFNGQDVGTERCPVPICMKADPYKLHIYHLRSPSIADVAKKDLDEGISSPEEAQSRMVQSDEDYDKETWFFNQIRDVSLVKYEAQLRERIQSLFTQTSQHPQRSS
ncbi:hypothetical protein WJX74_009462 [Apatococcus lobatus]|uniref:Glycosyltransferase family 92 protein n=1 Tax=Apatococcus lobatus TaxID=904363 RepID=A0AAW1QHK1_9CHLO